MKINIIITIGYESCCSRCKTCYQTERCPVLLCIDVEGEFRGVVDESSG